MYNPCLECKNHYDREYSKECDDFCDYAKASKELRALKRFKEYWNDFYGEGLEIAKWHLNGNTESFDNFYDAAMEEYERE